MQRDDQPPARPVSTQPSAWRLAVFLAIVLLAVALLPRLLRETADESNGSGEAPSAEAAATITQTLQKPGGVAREWTLEWSSGLTVLDALKRSDIEVEATGSGAMAFVTAIDRVANAGDGGWQFFVNRQPGKTSAAVHELQPGDHVLWKHGPYE